MDKKQNLIDARNGGEGMSSAFRTLNIPMRSDQRFYQTYGENGELVPDLQRGGYKMKILSDDQIQVIRAWSDEDCFLT